MLGGGRHIPPPSEDVRRGPRPIISPRFGRATSIPLYPPKPPNPGARRRGAVVGDRASSRFSSPTLGCSGDTAARLRASSRYLTAEHVVQVFQPLRERHMVHEFGLNAFSEK